MKRKNKQSQAKQVEAQKQAEQEGKENFVGGLIASIFGTKKKKDQSFTEQVVSQVAQQVGRSLRNNISKQIMRGILGAITKK